MTFHLYHPRILQSVYALAAMQLFSPRTPRNDMPQILSPDQEDALRALIHPAMINVIANLLPNVDDFRETADETIIGISAPHEHLIDNAKQQLLRIQLETALTFAILELVYHNTHPALSSKCMLSALSAGSSFDTMLATLDPLSHIQPYR